MCDNIGDSQTVVCKKSLWLYKGVFRLRFTRWCAMSQSVVGFCAIVWLVEWVAPTPSVRYRQFSLVNQIMPFFFTFFFIVCRPHCCPPLCFYFDHFVSHLCIILWPCIASLEKQSLWYLLHSVGTVDVNVCTLYSTFINTCWVLFLGVKK